MLQYRIQKKADDFFQLQWSNNGTWVWSRANEYTSLADAQEALRRIELRNAEGVTVQESKP